MAKIRTELPFLKAFFAFSEAKICVEVGVAKGSAACCFCEILKETGGKYFGFDMWTHYGRVKEFKVSGSKEAVSNKLIKLGFNDFSLIEIDTIVENKKFKSLCPNNIDFAFIDGDHSYLGIANDFSVVYPKLSQMGIIVFHDTCTIEGCREFILDLRTKFYDGTFDIIDIPLGNGKNRNPGITILMKRYHLIPKFRIDEINGSPSTPEQIERREVEWLNDEFNKNLGNMDKLNPNIELDLSNLGRYFNRKKFEKC